MTTWSDGYITDITYTSGWYRQQSPPILSLACLLGNADTTVPSDDDPIQVMELGCGQGFGALLMAASNPSWHITAIDFNPAHVAGARAWAAEAGLTNVTFMEADLSTLAEDPAARDIPEADFVTLHGIWTWVSASVQAGIVRLLRAKVRPGGVVHVSYNALPAWGARMGMQRLVHDSGRVLAGRSDRQAEEGFKITQALLAAGALHLRQPASNVTLIEHFGQMPIPYLAHEFMNANWKPCFMADVAAAFSDAKLEWVGSSNLIENFPSLTLTDEQIAVQLRFDDPLLRELVKDLCIDRSFRHDVFVRGVRRITPTARNAALMDVSIGLTIRPHELPLEAGMPVGKAELNRAFYEPITQALADGPHRVGDLLRAGNVQGRRDNPAELIGILVGLGFAEPAARSDAAPGEAAMRFNRITTRRLLRNDKMNRPAAAASYRLGTAVAANLLELFVLDNVLDGNSDVDRLTDLIGPPPDQRPELRSAIDNVLRVRLPTLRACGVY